MTTSAGGIQKPWLKNKQQGPTSFSFGAGGKPQTVPDDFEIDKDARYLGTIESYHKWSGYGFIKPDQPGIAPGNKIYVHWSNIQSDDRFPFLNKDMKVEFGLMKWKARHGHCLRAKTVTMPGGFMVAVQDEQDAEHKTFVGGQHLRYTGMLKFYDPRRSFGYVILDDGFALDEPVPKELRVNESEVHCGGKSPQRFMENLQVEFGIWKDKKGRFLVYNMTLPGGVPCTLDNIDNRKQLDGEYPGKIFSWNWSSGWGFIAPDDLSSLPKDAQLAIEAASEKAKQSGKSDDKLLYFRKQDFGKGCTSWLKRGMPCTYKVYVDDKGAGACEVSVDEMAAL